MRSGLRHGITAAAFLGLLATSGPAYSFENIRIRLTEISTITSAMSEPARKSAKRTEQHRIIITGIGNLQIDGSRSKIANKSNIRIRVNMPMNVSAARRGGRDAGVLSRAETGHASACLSFATRVLSNPEAFDLRIRSEASGIDAGTLQENKSAGGRDLLTVRISEDHFEDVNCTLIR